MEIKQFGLEAKLYTLENKNHMKAEVSDYGATLVNLLVADSRGIQKDVVLGYENAEGYRDGTVFLGATVGRSANRIKGGVFQLQGKKYTLEQNDHGNNLHSGLDYYSKRLWNVKNADDQSITFVLDSPDMDQGYPGNAAIQVTYALTDDNALEITYDAAADQDTVMNLTNHSYFNLNGHDAGSICGHQVWIGADQYTRAGTDSIPTGELTNVSETPMDFRTVKAIGQDIKEDYEALNNGKGYDHNYVLQKKSGFGKAAEALGDQSGILMEIYTDLPGMQLYTGNFLENENGKENTQYQMRDGICFETQYFPDAVNHPQFPSPVLKAGGRYYKKTVFKFSAT